MTDSPTTDGSPAYSRNSESTGPVHLLVTRIRGGDRSAAAAFLVQHEGQIRRRYRQRLGRAMRRMVDSQDLFSTIARRLDTLVRTGEVLALNERQMWALVFKIGDNALIDKARVMQRLERVEGPDSDVAYEWRCRLARAERAIPGGAESEIDGMLSRLDDRVDRQILSHWLLGTDHAAIAEELEMTTDAVRKRWERIRSHLRSVSVPSEVH